MKFIHIADVHLGAVPDSDKPWGKDREKEIWDSFRKIISVCNEEKVDLLLIAGDLFHKQPLVRELKEVNYLFSKLNTAQVVLMAGNHDYLGARSHYPEYEWDKRVHMFFSNDLQTMGFPELNTEVYGFSYVNRDITTPLYDNIKPADSDKLQILLAHGGDEKNIPINRKKLALAGFDYVALGHIHKPEIINSRMAYSGSLEPLDKNETGERGYILGEIIAEGHSGNKSIRGKKQTKLSFIPCSTRQYITLELNVNPNFTNGELTDVILDRINEHGTQHIYSIVIKGIRDETIRFDKEAICSLGNVLEVRDETLPDYDFDELYRENADNVIGYFIQRIREGAGQDEVSKKALYYGIEALLGARDR